MSNKKIVILGGGISGYGSAVLAQKQGFEVFLSDLGKIEPKYKKLLDKWNVPYEEGRHTESKILDADEVIKSPGIPDTAPIVKKLAEQGTPIISEIEFAGRYTNAKTICITGSNGKTTTTTLIYEMLKDAGFNVGLGGNIGESFAYQVAIEQKDWYVLELSSFQLDGCKDFCADIAVLTNITPDHLDRYGYSFDKYAESKMRITRNQTAEDTFIYQQDDPKTTEMVGRTNIAAREITFSGPDNESAASAAASAAGVSGESIARTLKNFKGIEHRIQSVGTIGGTEYINDSKATNVDSVRFAFEKMQKPVVWIAGGTDKGNDYSELYKFLPKIKALVCMGVDNAKLLESFQEKIPTFDTHSLDEAMKCAQKIATKGDVILLSPACASFDLFQNYEDRGRKFTEWVQNNK